MPELNRERGSNFRKLRILEREWRGRFGPNQEDRLFRCRSKTDSPDFREVGSMLLKPIRRVGRRLREIEFNGRGTKRGPTNKNIKRVDAAAAASVNRLVNSGVFDAPIQASSALKLATRNDSP